LAKFNETVIGYGFREFALHVLLQIAKIKVFKAPEPAQMKMEIISLLDIVGGRLEGLPRIKELVDLSKSLQNSSTRQKISLILLKSII